MVHIIGKDIANSIAYIGQPSWKQQHADAQVGYLPWSLVKQQSINKG